MRRVPYWLKRPLVSAWNAAHRVGRSACHYAEAIARGRCEHCAVCGRFRPMLYRRSIVPRKLEELWEISPRIAAALARRESCVCSRCGAKLRCRRIARAVLKLHPVGTPPAPARSLTEWARCPEVQALRIAEINRIDGLHDVLAQLPHFMSSDYRAGAMPGEEADGVRSEDLGRLTYADGAFDLVLTSESLEHVPDPGAALGELRRVLVPGGFHIFTVPLLPGVEKTFPRAFVQEDGTVVDLVPRIAHPGGDWGYPVFTEFGQDLPELLRRAGFEVEVHFGPNREDDLAQVYVCRKRSPQTCVRPGDSKVLAHGG